MRHLPISKTIIVKPVSSKCNLRCAYCYNSVEFRTHNKNEMHVDVIRKLHESIPGLKEKFIKFIWHGGEPILRGIDFYEEVVIIQKDLLTSYPAIRIENSVMTNGTLITDNWVNFIRANKWKLGVSIDGPQAIHDRFRVDTKRNGSYQRALRGRRIAEKAGISVGMIAVVTSETIKHPVDEYYRFLTSIASGFDISPCWETEQDGSTPEYVIHPDDFLQFAKALFDLWWENDDPKVNIRLFKNLLHGVLGGRPSNCAFSGDCASFIAIDSDGSVYPCGKFAGIQEFKFGNIIKNSLSEILQSRKYSEYLSIAGYLPSECINCRWLRVCNNGCTYDRYTGGGFKDISPFCPTWKSMFEHIEKKVLETTDKR